MPINHEEDHHHLHIEFYETEPKQNKRRTLAEGRPIFETKEMVRIRFVGDPKSVNCAPADECEFRAIGPDAEFVGVSYKERFPKHYEAFKNSLVYHGDGIPIAELPTLDKSRIAELKALNILSVESLAQLNRDGQKRLGVSALEMMKHAQNYLDGRAGVNVEMKMAEENAVLQAQIDALTERMAGLTEPQEQPVDSPFGDMESSDIKAWIKDRTGSTPMGNPGHATLVAMADKIIEKEAAEAA